MLLLAVAGALVFGTLVIALAPFGFRLAFANVSPETLAVLRLLGLALLFAGPVRFLKGLLASVDQQGKVILVNAASLALGSGIGWFLIGTHGIAGMAAAVAAAEAGTLAILLMIYRRTLRQK
jgi:O-antigen/teichoic acid export membrane protein